MKGYTMTFERFETWLELYKAAWESNEVHIDRRRALHPVPGVVA